MATVGVLDTLTPKSEGTREQDLTEPAASPRAKDGLRQGTNCSAGTTSTLGDKVDAQTDTSVLPLADVA